MIRAWRGRHRGAQQLVDAAVVVTAQIDVRDGQIEGLRDALAEALKKLDEERAARARDVAQLQYALAQAARLAGLDRYLMQGIEQARRLAEEDTAVVTQEQLHRARPTDEPTHHVPQPAPGWKSAPTERWKR